MFAGRIARNALFIFATVAVVAGFAAPARAEVVEEIVAWVNGDIITMSDLKNEEQLMIAEAYRRYTGDELDNYVEGVRSGLLLTLIDNKILVHRAKTLFDIDGMTASLYDNFKAQQNITDDNELRRMLEAEGLTVPGLKQRLLEMYAPDEVIRFEVGGRIAVGEREIREYYDAHPKEFTVPGSVNVQEIVLLAGDETAKNNRRPEAREIYERAKQTDDFGALAKEVSEAGTAENGGALGPLVKGDLNERLEKVAFSVPVGEISDLLEMPWGFHIVKVVSREEAQLKSYEEVHDMLRNALEDQRYYEQRSAYMDKTRDNAEWCVKPAYRDRLSIESPECPSL
jgi:peptidyl-prolyl cis-trans isomerase SurA